MGIPPLPDGLQYLQPVFQELAGLPPADLNEDVDSTSLEAALRARVSGLVLGEARKRIQADREMLGAWLKTRGDEFPAGFLVSGFLASPGLAKLLLQPPPQPEPGPTIEFGAPAGWRIERAPRTLNLYQGDCYVAGIVVIDRASCSLMARQYELMVLPPTVQGTMSHGAVRFGDVSGSRHAFVGTGSTPEKKVAYFLEIPGGAVRIQAESEHGEFDEAVLEAQLHTLRLSAPGD